jgi:hypothetical protein
MQVKGFSGAACHCAAGLIDKRNYFKANIEFGIFSIQSIKYT